MSNYRINEYVYLLKLAKDFFVDSLEEYNQRDTEAVQLAEYHKLYYQRKYHAFAYSQLMYVLYERLKEEASSDSKNIKLEQVFKRDKKSAVRKVCALFAQKVKHVKQDDAVNISPISFLEINFPDGEVTFKPESLTLSSISGSTQLSEELKNTNLLELINKSYDELLEFLKIEGYDY